MCIINETVIEIIVLPDIGGVMAIYMMLTLDLCLHIIYETIRWRHANIMNDVHKCIKCTVTDDSDSVNRTPSLHVLTPILTQCKLFK